MSDAPRDARLDAEGHRRRRREAYARAAAVHERAAMAHETAADLFERHGELDKAARHRRAAQAEHRRAVDAQHTADSQ
ncbi:MAG TPA: hypothetical protein VKD21_06900 [Acidimicrobiales bacterium]|nr:hypothetical protein [Acidimicrobiales bacterium]